jgi:hypothetical protein
MSARLAPFHHPTVLSAVLKELDETKIRGYVVLFQNIQRLIYKIRKRLIILRFIE